CAEDADRKGRQRNALGGRLLTAFGEHGRKHAQRTAADRAQARWQHLLRCFYDRHDEHAKL
ncbi:hypothetical protein ACC740_39040, partial [Rhizobium ruizarguesonis]